MQFQELPLDGSYPTLRQFKESSQKNTHAFSTPWLCLFPFNICIIYGSYIELYKEANKTEMQGVDFHGTETLELGVESVPTELRAQRPRRANAPPPPRSPPEF